MRILVAEDDENSRILLCTLLESEGHTVMSAQNGRIALELAQNSVPDIIISDILMPEMDGYSLCRQIKADPKLAHIAVIFYTAQYTKVDDEKLGLALGVSRFVLKPQTPENFIKILKEVINEYKAQKLPEPATPIDSSSLTSWHEEVLIRKLQEKLLDLEKEKKNLFVSREKYRNIIESLKKDFIFFSYDTHGKLIYVSPSVFNILGYSQEEFIEFNDKLWLRNSKNQLEKYRIKDSPQPDQVQYEFEITDKNGSIHQLCIKEVPLFDKEQNLIAVDGVAEDITEKKKNEALLDKTRKHLATSEKLASIGRLAAGVSHEVLNPLNILSIQNQMLRNKVQDNPIVQKFCGKMENEVDRITKIMGALLSFSRKGNAKRDKVSIKEVIEDLLDLVKPTFNLDNIVIETEFCEPPLQFFADKEKLRQVFLNLINNAKQAMPGGGVLTIKCQRKGATHGKSIDISISDTGKGIAEENQNKIFDPFFTTKPEGEGTGVGLSVVHSIIESHGGSITVESQEGKGTTFNIDLPIREPDV